MDAETKQEFEKLGLRFEKIEKRFDGVDERLDRTETKLTTFMGEMRAFRDEMYEFRDFVVENVVLKEDLQETEDRLGARIDAVAIVQDNHGRRLVRLERKTGILPPAHTAPGI